MRRSGVQIPSRAPQNARSRTWARQLERGSRQPSCPASSIQRVSERTSSVVQEFWCDGHPSSSRRRAPSADDALGDVSGVPGDRRRLLAASSGHGRRGCPRAGRRSPCTPGGLAAQGSTQLFRRQSGRPSCACLRRGVVRAATAREPPREGGVIPRSRRTSEGRRRAGERSSASRTPGHSSTCRRRASTPTSKCSTGAALQSSAARPRSTARSTRESGISCSARAPSASARRSATG